MGEVFITRKGGGGKAAAPTISITEVGGTWIELEITNNDAAASGATIFVLANYDPNSATDFDLQAAQNGFVFAVAQGATVTQLITGLDPDTSYTVSASAAVIKKLPSNIVTIDPVSLLGVPAPTLGTISDTVSAEVLIPVTNNDTQIPLTIRVAATTTTTVPTTYPFELVVQPNSTSNMPITGLTDTQTYYYHARAFNGAFSSNNVVIGPFVKADNPLYAFTNWTFTNAGITGRIGPTITEVRSAYSSQSWAQNNAYLAMTTNGIQNWTVPGTGSYQIEAFGAQGGLQSQSGYSAALAGLGARMRGNFTLTKGEVVRILVGQQGISINNTCGGGSGGGGTFVVKSGSNTNGNILVIAGGGGGAGRENNQRNGQNGTTGTSGTASTGSNVSGGANGAGGAQPPGTPCGMIYVSGSGGGFLTNGGGPGGGPGGGDNGGGFAFANGGAGGDRTRGSNGSEYVDGGFGGGGMGNYGAGAGGGYSGGGGGQGMACNCETWRGGGGGGSFTNGSSQSNSAGVRSGHGQVIITKL